MNATELLTQLKGVKKAHQRGWYSYCPAHDDNRPSLSINEAADGKILLNCFAGCKTENIVAAIGLTMHDLFPTKDSAPPPPNVAHIVAEYNYTDPTGKLIYQVCRFEPKDFRQRQPDGQGGWIWNMQGIERVLYRLPEVMAAVKDGSTIFICEGEKACEALAAFGLVAACNVGGACKWREEYTTTLTDAALVVIIADKDAPGRAHAETIAKALYGKVKTLKVVELPDWNGHTVKDAADFTGAGGTMTEFLQVVEAAPTWSPNVIADDTAATIDAGEWIETAPPPVTPILNGLFEIGDKFEIIGGSKTRKTFFMIHAVLCLASGRDFLGWRIDHPWRVLVVQMEVKPQHFHRRIHKLAAAIGLTREDLGGRLFILNGRGLKLAGVALFEHVRKLAEKHGAEIIFFDPLYKLTAGDENAAADVKPTLAEFDRLAETPGAAVGYVHHDSKGDAGDRDIRDRGAGSGVLARDCDCRIILTAHESEPDAFVVETVTRNFPPQDGFTIGWGENETGYCFKAMPSVPALKRTSRSKQVGPKLAALVEQCASLIGTPVTKGGMVAKVQLQTSVGRDKALAIVKGLETRPGVVCRRAKAKGAQWYIGAEDQMELLPGEKRD